jgi:5-methylcytosine-specific restriction endonuclease McrA
VDDARTTMTTDSEAELQLPPAVRCKLRRRGHVRSAVFARDRSLCRYCARLATTIDHVKPRCDGGRYSMANCVACCFRCNKRKGGRTPEQAGMILLPAPMEAAA